jgi:tetratricopeptide (TPR) repeat protein
MKTDNKLLQIIGFLGAWLIVSNHSVKAFSWGSFFKSDKTKQSVDPIKKLEDQLVHDPKNPYINYSLGVALYKNKQFDEAKNNFERAVLYATNLVFKEQAHFNLATCLYKNALSIMPENWESPEQEVDVKILDQAASLASNAIKEYNSTLEINEKNEKAITNKKEAEKLLRKNFEKKETAGTRKP